MNMRARIGNVLGHLGTFGVLMVAITGGNGVGYLLGISAIIIGFSLYVFSE